MTCSPSPDSVWVTGAVIAIFSEPPGLVAGSWTTGAVISIVRDDAFWPVM